MDDGLNFAQVVVFLDHFKDLPDHRQRGKVMYRLNEIFACVPCGGFGGGADDL